MAKTKTPDPIRAQLAEAIERHDLAQRQVEANRRAREDVQERTWRAIAAVEAAAKAIEAARDGEAAAMTAAFMGGHETAPATTIRSARAAHQDAEDDLATLRSVLETLAGREEPGLQDLRFAKMKLDEAVKATVQCSPGIAKLLADFARCRAEFAALEDQLRWLAVRGLLPPEAKDWGSSSGPFRHESTLPAPPDWPAAITALRTDADAPLPAN